MITYDASACNAADHVLVMGRLGDFQNATALTCSIGSTGSFTVAPPGGDVWFLIAGVEGSTYSSLGRTTMDERSIGGIVGSCATLSAQEFTAICP